MQLCTGVDIIEISRIAKSIQRSHFVERVFSWEEQEQFQQRGCPPSFLAGCFCGKEAFSKALGTGVRDFALAEVSVLRDKLGKPYLSLSGSAAALAQERGLVFDISISNTKDLAIAFVVGYQIKKEL